MVKRGRTYRPNRHQAGCRESVETLDDVSGAVGRSAQNPPFAVEPDEVAALLTVDQFDEHFELSVVVEVALLALTDPVGIEGQDLLNGAIGPIPAQRTDVHAVFPAAFLIEVAVGVVQPVVSEGLAGSIMNLGPQGAIGMEPPAREALARRVAAAPDLCTERNTWKHVCEDPTVAQMAKLGDFI